MDRLALALPALLFSMALGAEAPVATAVRSIVTAPAGLTDSGVLEMELGAQQVFGRDRTQGGNITAQLNLGLTHWLDLRCGWTGYTWWRNRAGDGDRGASDPYIGGQVLFAGQDKAGADIGLVYSHVLPRADATRGLGTGMHQDTLLVSLSRSFGQWSLDFNAGFNRTRQPETLQKVNQALGSLAVTYAPALGWNLTLDTYAVPKSDLGEREVGNILAASCALSERLKVDMSLERGWSDAAPRWALNAGLVYRIGHLWGR